MVIESEHKNDGSVIDMPWLQELVRRGYVIIKIIKKKVSIRIEVNFEGAIPRTAEWKIDTSNLR